MDKIKQTKIRNIIIVLNFDSLKSNIHNNDSTRWINVTQLLFLDYKRNNNNNNNNNNNQYIS